MKSILGVLLLVLLTVPAVAFDLTVVSFNVESDSDTLPAKVADDLRRILPLHIWGLSEVNAKDFEIYRRAIGDEFGLIEGNTGRGDRLAIIFDARILEQKNVEELSDARGSRHPLVAKFKIKGSKREFLFVVNHLQRGNKYVRQTQAGWLNQWAQKKAEGKDPPAIIFAGDYNFDVSPSTRKGNTAFDLFMSNGTIRWVEPACIFDNNCPSTGTGCNKRYDSILDFVFLAGSAQSWTATSEILFKNDATYCANEGSNKKPGASDHRPIRAVLTF